MAPNRAIDRRGPRPGAATIRSGVPLRPTSLGLVPFGQQDDDGTHQAHTDEHSAASTTPT